MCKVRAPEHVDHDHLTGKVRGVLCFGCNGGLGQFQDNVEWMTAAIEYIQRHREVHEPAAPYILSVA